MSQRWNIEQFKNEKTKLEQDLVAFAKESKTLNAEIRQQRQRELQNTFSTLETKLQTALQSEQKNAEAIVQLQQDIQALKKNYSEVLSSSIQEGKSLNSVIENMQYGKNELITLKYLEGTPLKTTMLSVMGYQDFDTYPEFKDKSPDERLEMIFRKINTVLTRFYARKFNLTPDQSLPDHLTKVIIPATERFLMDLLKVAGHETNVNFLGQVSTMSFDKLGELFTSIKSFSEKFTLPFAQGKALLNFSDFVALPKNASQLQKLKDPYELYTKVLQNPIWTGTIVSDGSKGKNKEDTVNINNITWEQFWLNGWNTEVSPEQLQSALELWKQKIQQEIWTIQMVNSPATVKKIMWILDKTDSFFEKTQSISGYLLDQMDAFWGVSQALKSSFRFDIWKQMKKMPVIGGIMNFVLSLLGFSGGIEGVERAWKKRRIDKELKQPQKDYISETFKSYMEGKNIEENVAKTLLETYKLKVSEDKLPKFAVDLPLIKEQISKKIAENPDLINLSTLRNTRLGKEFDGKQFVEEVKENGGKSLKLKTSLSEEQRSLFVEAYLKMMLEHFADKKHSDSLDALENGDTLAFILISGVTIDYNNVIDGVEAQVFLPSQFYEVPKEQVKKENTEEKSTTSSTITAESIKKYWNTPAVRNNNPWNIMDTAFGGKKVAGERFTVFDSPKQGFDALIAKIDNIKAGGSKTYQPDMTLLAYIEKYAPRWDGNNPEKYAQDIAKYVWNITTVTKIKDIDSVKLASAHARFEDGKMYKQLTDLWIVKENIA